MTIRQLRHRIARERMFLMLYTKQGNDVAALESERRLADLLKMLGERS